MTAADAWLSVRHLAAEYRRRRQRLSPVEVTEHFLGRIDRLDDAVRSMVTVTADLARRQAQRAERRIAAGDTSPLLGVPIALKDLIDVRGVVTTAGSEVLRDNVASTSATVWRRLEAAGAVLLGKANTHEFAYGGLTEPTANPWDLGHLVGGSSGGPAAALAAGLAPLAIGTDTAGSVRIPANLCGVTGLKPTRGAVSAAGVIPLAPSLDVVGPMGHHPADLALALAAMAGPPRGPRDPAAVRRDIRARARRRALRFGVLADPGRLSPGASRAYATVSAVAERFGVVEAVELPDFDETVMTNFVILGVEAVLVHEQWRDQRSQYTEYVRDRLEQAGMTRAIDYERARRDAVVLRRQVDQLLAEHDVVLVPGIPYPAPPLGVTRVDVGGVIEDRDTSLCRNTGFANVTGHPSLALPVLLEGGLPVGVQLLGGRGDDVALLAVGEMFADDMAVPTVAPRFRT